jgi:hypothetical protein
MPVSRMLNPMLNNSNWNNEDKGLYRAWAEG